MFPGGNFDKKQDNSLAMTAIRETFEESGLLLAFSRSSAPPLLETVLDEARHKIHQQKLLFPCFLQSKNIEADVDSLLPFTQWITPVGSARSVEYIFLMPLQWFESPAIYFQSIPYTILRCVPPSCSFFRFLIGCQARTNPKAW